MSGEELFSESEDSLYTGVEAQDFSEEERAGSGMCLQKKMRQPRFKMFLRMNQKKRMMKREYVQSVNEQSEDPFSSGEVTEEGQRGSCRRRDSQAQKAPMEGLSPILVVEDPVSISSGISGRSRSYGKQFAFTV